VTGLVAALDDVTEQASAGEVKYRRAGEPFAVVDARAVEIHLLPDIAEAVLRTPETTPSARGSGWVRFAPRELEPSVADRLEAWLTTAWRAAGR
jgi:hypothetical protein